MPISENNAAQDHDGRRVRGDRTRARVLDAALKIASIQGLEGVTIGPVALESGVSKGHLTNLFGNRVALQLAVLDAAVELWRVNVLKASLEAENPAEALKRFCLGWFEYVEKRVLPGGCMITAASSEFRAMEGPVRDRVIDLRRRYIERLRKAVAAALKSSPDTQEAEDAVFRILAYQAAGNVASLLGDEATFARAKKTTSDLISILIKDL